MLVTTTRPARALAAALALVALLLAAALATLPAAGASAATPRAEAKAAAGAEVARRAAPGARAAATGAERWRTVAFDGRRLRVPASWPVIRLAERPRACVRLDRRAVYLGRPGAEQRCPSGIMGRRRAILVEPVAAARAPDSRRERGATASAVRKLASAGDYTGLGFDACTAPSPRAMEAWLDSPYRAVGVYIGGTNRACSQPNLTAAWVREQIAEGWYLIPTYVGLQAPTTSCSSCAKLSAASASLQGAAAAADAIAQAEAIGIGPGSPIYYDMESYTRTTSATNATLNFLAGWTTALHDAGYVSGVYSSSSSGIADLSARVGTAYPLPDNIWVANWNGQKNTLDPNVPPTAWTQHQRIHQYRGGHDETWGGVTINIDNNYVEGATVGAVSAAAAEPKGRLESVSSPLPGQVRLVGWAFDPSLPAAPVAIRAYVGGPAGKKGARAYELGQVAALPREDVGSIYRAAGPNHGFDVTFPVLGTRRQQVCAYAVSAGGEGTKQLGCRTVGIKVPLSLLRVRHFRGGARLALRCEWPAGLQCPGQVVVRARVWIGKGRRARALRAVVARRPFRLTGGTSRAVSVALSRRGRRLVGNRTKLRAHLTLAIPGGRVTRAISLRP